MAVVFKLRRGPSTEWTTDNPVLSEGEPGFETDTRKLKIGNGVASWNDLSYIYSGSGGGGGEDVEQEIAAAIEAHRIATDPHGDRAFTTSALSGKANTDHQHSGDDITSGTIAIARIPTGTTSSSVALGNHTHEGGGGPTEPGEGGGTTSGYRWDNETSAYVLVEDHKINTGPNLPEDPSEGDVWFNSVTGSVVVSGFNAATSLPKDLTSGGVAHEPGAWTEFIASTDAIFGMITVNIHLPTSISGNTRSMLLDVGVGPSGSEVAIISGLDIGRCGYIQNYDIPLVIPAGSRVSLRIQARETGITTRAQLILSRTPQYAVYYGGTWRYAGSGSQAIALGIDASASLPTALNLASSINLWGTWTVISDTTPTTFRWLLIMPSGPLVGNWGATNVEALFDVAIGPEGFEVSIISGAIAAGYTNAEAVARLPLLVAVDIPAGSRLTARYQASVLSASPPSLSAIGIS